MQFLHLLLPLGLLSLVDSGWIGRTDTQISAEKMKQLEKELKLSTERRKSRVARSVSKSNGPTLTEEEKKEFDELAAKMTELNPENQAKITDDPFSVNQKEGVTDNLFEGDIQLSEVQMSTFARAHEGRNKRQATANNAIWTNNTVYYFFDPSINQAQKNAVFESIDFLNRRTCLKFIQSNTAKNRIRFFTGKGCWSAIGMNGGQQDLSLGGGCENFGTVVHEIMHALGIWHMQHRYDRDNFVLIDTSPVPEEQKHNFDKLQPYDTIDSTPYEYGSVMHYSATTFSANGKPAMIPKDPRYSVTIGSKVVSFYDLKMINDLYQCYDSTPVKCQNGGFSNPFLPGQCICPGGYGDALCDKRPPGCGQELTATANWQTTQLTAGTPNNDATVLVFRYCNHWITAPKGKKIQIKVTAMEQSTCHNGCGFNGIEPKVLPNPQVTNPRYCCPTQLKGEILTSELNPTPVIVYNRNHYSRFTFQYRFVDAPAPEPTPPSKTTVAPQPNLECRDTQADCYDRKQRGYCDMKIMPFNFVKYACAVTCGLCDKRPSPCYDRQKEECASFDCNAAPPMLAEFYCAKTCGFCGSVYPKRVVTPSTTPRITTPTTPEPACHDTQNDCAARKAQGFCDMKQQPFNIVKMACAATCGICGIPPSPCYDMDGPSCGTYDCKGTDPMFAEFSCAKTCGFCPALATTPMAKPTTSSPTTIASKNCHDTQKDCAARKANGICEMKQQPFNIVKMACAATCGICGIPHSPCYDMNKEECLNYDCEGNDPMFAEFYCAKTCGFCGAPSPATTPKPTVAPVAKRACHDTQTDCAARKANGICDMKQQPFNIVKMACASSCNLCGKTPSPCDDMLKGQCATYDCTKEDPMVAEFYCAKTCGFCEKPN